MNSKEVVRAGYDALGTRYREAYSDYGHYHEWLDELVPLLPPSGRILDLGCGDGVPVSKRLSATYQVVGVDLSPTQVHLAQSNVPDATFLCGDMTSLDFEPESFAAVVAFYSIIHVPLIEQQSMLEKIKVWLKPGGYFMATLGNRAWTGIEHDWLQRGVTMYWSHADDETYIGWLGKAGLEVAWSRFIPEGKSGHSLILARKS